MTFKDYVRADHDVYLCNDEFAEWAIIDNVILKAIIQPRTSEKSGRISQNYDGLYGDFSDVYFKTADYCRKRERIPKFSEFVKIYDRHRQLHVRYGVVSSIDEMGMTHLILAAYRQNNLRQQVDKYFRS